MNNILLNNGVKIPQIGFGTWKAPTSEVTINAVKYMHEKYISPTVAISIVIVCGRWCIHIISAFLSVPKSLLSYLESIANE